jgi:multiple sugar transport system substrate-binding protein
MGRFNRRGLARLGLGVAAAGILAGRAGGLLAAEARRIRAAGYVESQEQLKQTLAVWKRYAELHPDVTINPELTDFGSFTDKLATEATGGNAPDLFSVNLDLLGEYSRRGVIQPLEKWTPNPIDLAKYVEGPVKAATRDGHLWAIPNDCVAPVIVYSNAAFEKAGIAVPDQMWTWEKYGQTAIDLHEALKPRFWGTEDGGGSYIMLDLYLRGRGKMFFTAERRLGFQKPDLVEWLVYWQNLRDKGGVPPGDIQAMASGDDLSRTGLISGRAAMLPQLTDSFVGLQNLTKDELGLHFAPNGFDGGEMKQHHYVYPGNSTAIWSKTPDPDLIIDIIHFMHSDPEGSAIFYDGSGMIPSTLAGRARMAKEGSDADRRTIAYLEAIEADHAPPRNPNFPGVSGVLRRMNEAVAFAKSTPDQAAADFIAEAERRIKT